MHSLPIAALPQRRSGSRYRIAEVDAFLEECATALRARDLGRAPSLTDSDVITRRFGTVMLFGVGYDADAVDQLLDEIAVQLRGRLPGL